MNAKRVTPEEFKKEVVKPGTKERFLVRVGELSTGSEIALPVVVVRGKREGPTVYVAAGQHAEETGSIDAVKRFAAQLTPEEVSGTAVLVPLQNAPAWVFRSRLYPLDAPNVADLASLTRGEAGGIMTSRVMYALTECIAANANFALDVHSTHLDSMNYPFTFVFTTGSEPPEVQRKRLELARQVGNEIVWVGGLPGRAGVNAFLNGRGCPTIAMETGEGWRNLEPFPSILIRGIRNFCKAAGLLSGRPEMPSVQIEVNRRHEITTNRGGMSHLYVKPGDYVKAGQVVGEIRDMFDDVLEELKTPVNGIIQRCSLLPTVATGARVCNVAQTDRGEEWAKRVVPELERKITLPVTLRPRN